MSSIIFNSDVTPDLIRRMTPQVNAQALAVSPALDEGWIPMYDKKGVQGSVMVRAGGNQKTGFIADGGTTSYASKAPKRLKYDAKILYTGLRIGRQAADMTEDIDDGVDLVLDAFEVAKEDMGRQLATAVQGARLGNPTAAVTADTDDSVTVSDTAGFEIQCEFDVYSDADAFVETVLCTDVEYNADGTGTVTFVGAGTGGAADNSWTTSYKFYLKGAAPSGGEQITSVEDVCADGSLYGQANTAYGWASFLDSTAAVLSRTKLDNLALGRFRLAKKPFDCLLGNSVMEQRLARLEEDQIRYADPSKGLDRRGEGRLHYKGKPFVVDENIKSTNLILTRKDSLKLHRFQMFAPPGGEKAKRSQMRWAEGTHDYILPMSGYFELRCENRRQVAMCSAISG